MAGKIAGRQSRPLVDLSVESRPVRPRAIGLRVFAMARPRRPADEHQLVAKAALELGAEGSRRSQALVVAEAVAALAVAQIAMDELDVVMAKGAAIFRTPAVAALAFADDAVAPEMVMAEAMAAFQRRGCRHAEAGERAALDSALRDAVTARLSERYRRA